MLVKSGNRSADQLSGALAALAKLQQAVEASRTGKPVQEADMVKLDSSVLAELTGAVAHEFADLRRELGGRLDMVDLKVAAVADPDGGGWFVKLVDTVGQHVDFRVDRKMLGQVSVVVHDHVGVGEHNAVITNEAAILQLAKLLGNATLDPDFKRRLPASSRHLADARRSLAAATSATRVRQQSELMRAVYEAARGKVPEMEKAISLYCDNRFSFRMFNAAYVGNTWREGLQLDFRDQQNNTLTITVEGTTDQNGDVDGFNATLNWSMQPRQDRTQVPPNAQDLRDAMSEFNFRNPGNSGGPGGDGQADLTQDVEKKFIAELLRFAKKRKWNGNALKFDTSKGGLAQLLRL